MDKCPHEFTGPLHPGAAPLHRHHHRHATAQRHLIEHVELDLQLDFDKVVNGEWRELDFESQITLSTSSERPFQGDLVDVNGILKMQCIGKHCFAAVSTKVTLAEFDWSWGYDDREEAPPMRSIEQAYTDLLGLAVEEAEDLAEVDAVERDGHSGDVVTALILDFFFPTSRRRRSLRKFLSATTCCASKSPLISLRTLDTTDGLISLRKPPVLPLHS